MSAERYTGLQICIICFLVLALGTKVLWRHPEWFDSEQRDTNEDLDYGSATAARPYFTLASATSTDESGFFDYVLPIFSSSNGHERSR